MGIEVREGNGGGRVYRVRLRRTGVHVSETFRTLAEARSYETDVLVALERGHPVEKRARPSPLSASSVTVEGACRHFVDGMVSGQIRTRGGHPYKLSTIRGVENRLRLHVLPHLGALGVAELRRADVRLLVEQIAMAHSPATAVNVRDCLRLVLQRQVDLEVLDANPAHQVPAPTPERQPPRFLTPQEADDLQQAADRQKKPLLGALVATCLGLGCRLGELQALGWGAGGLDLDAGVVTIRVTLDRTGVLVLPKSRRARVIHLGPELTQRLREYRLACGRPGDGERVFRGSHRRAWEHARVEVGIPGLRIHDLRHTAAAFWLAGGLTIHAVAELLGHTDATLVLRLYGHALPSEVASAAERLEAWRAEQRSG